MINAFGNFEEDLNSVEVSFQVMAHSSHGETRTMVQGEGDFCKLVSLKQQGIIQCPPKRGLATIFWEITLLQGWIPEVRSVMDMLVFIIRLRKAGNLQR